MILNKFLSRTEYSSYEDLYKNFKISIPENFNFAYDVVDEYAKEEPKREALVWCDDEDESHIFTFKDLSLASQRTANFLVEQGIVKGDRVMLILRRRYEFWFFLLALHRVGAIAIPATNMLAAEDLEYRFKAADVKMVVTYDEPALQKEVDKAKAKCPSVEKLVTVGQTARQNWVSFYDDYEIFPAHFPRPEGDAATHNDDIMVVYFTSGTSSNPKMVAHTFTYPLGHIVTAKYWQHVVDGGRHLTVAETGWAKALWGKIYGQWIAGSAVFTYDMKVFIPGKLLEKMAEYKVTTFCAPPTVYRYILHHGLSKYDLSSLKYCTTAGEALNLDIYNQFFEQPGLQRKQLDSRVVHGVIFRKALCKMDGKGNRRADFQLLFEPVFLHACFLGQLQYDFPVVIGKPETVGEPFAQFSAAAPEFTADADNPLFHFLLFLSSFLPAGDGDCRPFYGLYNSVKLS